jgi:hypothetical protein
MKVIYSVFAGRKDNLSIQLRYLDKLVEQGDIDEVHMWNFTREISDSIWLKTLFEAQNPFIFSISKQPNQQLVKQVPCPPSSNVKYTIGCRGASDAHLILTDTKANLYEIILGGWNNTRSVIRYNNTAYLCENYGPVLSTSQFMYLTVVLENQTCQVYQDKRLILKSNVTFLSDPILLLHEHNFAPLEWDISMMKDLLIDYKSHYQFTPKNMSSFKMIDPETKLGWSSYYNFYTQEKFNDHILIKADDDIVFIDTKNFKDFITTRKQNPEVLLVFPNIINNGVAASYQQGLELIPKSIGIFPYDTFEGNLWESASLCSALHYYFISEHQSFIEKASNLPNIQHKCGDRFSINMFAILSKDFGIFQQMPMGIEDELHLSITLSKILQRSHLFTPRTVVAHLSFYKQVLNGLDENDLRDKYHRLALVHC